MNLSLLQFLMAPLGTGLACVAVYKLLVHRQAFDYPNARSSHQRPTPRGGGIAFIPVICPVAAWGTLGLPPPLALPLLILLTATLCLCLVGAVDDLRGLGPVPRLLAQSAAGLGLLGAIAYAHPWADAPLTLGLVAAVGLLFLLWSTNLYNFMDGIDGLAGLQAVLAGLLIASLDYLGIYGGNLAGMGLLVALCCGAFLGLNFPPARMFMGDAGSAALGFLLAGVAVIEFTVAAESFWLWVVGLAGFIADATATLLVRLFRGQKVYQAHRSHLYQLATLAFQGRDAAAGAGPEQARARAHRRYLLLFTALFLIWQVPWALLIATGTLPGIAGAAACLLPLLAGAVYLGAGRERLRPWR